MKDPTCRDCMRLTSGYCGRHGHTTFANNTITEQHIFKEVTPEQIIKRIADREWKTGPLGMYYVDTLNQDKLALVLAELFNRR